MKGFIAILFAPRYRLSLGVYEKNLTSFMVSDEVMVTVTLASLCCKVKSIEGLPTVICPDVIQSLLARFCNVDWSTVPSNHSVPLPYTSMSVLSWENENFDAEAVDGHHASAVAGNVIVPISGDGFQVLEPYVNVYSVVVQP